MLFFRVLCKVSADVLKKLFVLRLKLCKNIAYYSMLSIYWNGGEISIINLALSISLPFNYLKKAKMVCRRKYSNKRTGAYLRKYFCGQRYSLQL